MKKRFLGWGAQKKDALYIIERIEVIETDGIKITQSCFYNGNSWTDNVCEARQYHFDHAISLKTLLSVTLPVFTYDLTECKKPVNY